MLQLLKILTPSFSLESYFRSTEVQIDDHSAHLTFTYIDML